MDAEGNILPTGGTGPIPMGQIDDCTGRFHLAQSAAGNVVSEYHLQAAIARNPLRCRRLFNRLIGHKFRIFLRSPRPESRIICRLC